MPFGLDPEHKAAYEATLRFARSVTRDLRQADREGEFSLEAWQRCATHGLLGLAMPVELGGSADGILATVANLEAFGRGCQDNGLAFSIASQLSSVQLPLLHHGSEAARQRYLPALIRGELIGAHAATEADAGSDVNLVRTQAVRCPGGWRLNGSKIFSSLAPQSGIAIVLARCAEDDRLTEFIVNRSEYQVSPPHEKIGLRTAPVGEIVLEDSFVPDEDVLGSSGSGLLRFMTAMDIERLLIMAHAVGAMQRQLEQCISYAQERKQFGQPIGKFQAVSHRIATMKVRLETSRLLLYQAAALRDEGRRTTLEAAMVKLVVSENRHANALDAVRIFGGYGCMTENEIERELRDAIPGLIYSGTSDILRNTIARLLGL